MRERGRSGAIGVRRRSMIALVEVADWRGADREPLRRRSSWSASVLHAANSAERAVLAILVMDMDMLGGCRRAHGEHDQGSENNSGSVLASRGAERLQRHALRADRATVTLDSAVASPAWFSLQTSCATKCSPTTIDFLAALPTTVFMPMQPSVPASPVKSNRGEQSAGRLKSARRARRPARTDTGATPAIPPPKRRSAPRRR